MTRRALLLPVVGVANAGERPRKRVKSRPGAPLESVVLRAVLIALNMHPAVAFVWRANSGAFVVGSGKTRRYIKAGFEGCSDIIGMLKTGQFLAVEVKRPGGKMTERQYSFLCRVERDGGVAFMATGVDDVTRGLTGRGYA